MYESPSAPLTKDAGQVKAPFVEKGLRGLALVLDTGYRQWEAASRDGLFQRLDARVKVLFLILFVIIISLKKDIYPELAVCGMVFVLAALSRLDLFRFWGRVLALGFLLGFLVALPSALNIITDGQVVLPLFRLSEPHDFWVYHVPATVGFTKEGLSGVALLTARVVSSLSVSFLVLHTTPLSEIIRALKAIRVPDAILMVISLASKYVFTFAQVVAEMHLAKKGRLAGAVSGTEARGWAIGRMAVIFRKTRAQGEELFRAMTARGFAGEIRIAQGGGLTAMDWAAGLLALAVGGFLLWL
jgi:cobalt/nickel transport system permease protein